MQGELLSSLSAQPELTARRPLGECPQRASQLSNKRQGNWVLLTSSPLVEAIPRGINSLVYLRHEGLLCSCGQQRPSDSEWQGQSKAIGSVRLSGQC